MKRLILIASLALAACGGKKTDYSASKLVTETVTKEGVTYTVDIPEGLPKDDRNAGDWSDARVEYDYTPKVFTGVYPLDMPTELESAKRETALSTTKAKFVRAEQRPNGWAVTLEGNDKHSVEASTMTKLPSGKIIKCTAVQDAEGEVPSFDKTKAMLEAICGSIKAK